jgi:hypothetical protein
MERLDVAETLLNEAEEAVDVTARTRGSGDHSTPVVLLSKVNAYRRAKGNSSRNGLRDTDGDGDPEEVLLKHIYEASATFETRSEDEVESYQLARSLYERLSAYEEFPERFHSGLNDFSLGELKQGGFQAPTPEPVYKHTFSISLDFSDEIAFTIENGLVGSFDNSISNN